MRIFRRPPEAATKTLLISCELPVADLDADHFDHFFGCGSEASPEGVVGVELHGQVALLRSLAVSQSARGRGCGKRLVLEAEAHARAHGVRELYLITDIAEAFFRSIGYAAVDRSTVPDAIRQTPEYSSLCPSDAAVMVRSVRALPK